MKQSVRTNKDGKYRKVNNDLLMELIKSGFNTSEYKILLYFIWNISADKYRTHTEIKLSTLSNRTGMNKSTTSKYLNKLIKNNVIHRIKKSMYEINLNTDQWFIMDTKEIEVNESDNIKTLLEELNDI